MKKTEDKNLISHSLGNNGAMTDWSMGYIDESHATVIQVRRNTYSI